MKIINYPIIDSSNEKEFRAIFKELFIDNHLKFQGYDVKVREDDFDHACYERGKGGIEKLDFGIRRAKRIYILKAICEEEIPYQIFWQISRKNKTVCILCGDIDTEIILRPIKKGSHKSFRLVTIIALGDHVISKIKNLKIDSIEILKVGDVFKTKRSC